MLTLPYAGRPRKMWLSEKVTHTSQEIIHNKPGAGLVPLNRNRGFPIRASSPRRSPPHQKKRVSVRGRAPPATAHSPKKGLGGISQRALESPGIRPEQMRDEIRSVVLES